MLGKPVGLSSGQRYPPFEQLGSGDLAKGRARGERKTIKIWFSKCNRLAEILRERIETVLFEVNIKKKKKSLLPHKRLRNVLSSFQDVLKAVTVPKMGILLRVFYL